MTLMYRGIAYNQSAAVSVSTPNRVTGKYRGAETHIVHPTEAPVHPSRCNLKYRGVPYQSTANPVLPSGWVTAF